MPTARDMSAKPLDPSNVPAAPWFLGLISCRRTDSRESPSRKIVVTWFFYLKTLSAVIQNSSIYLHLSMLTALHYRSI